MVLLLHGFRWLPSLLTSASLASKMVPWRLRWLKWCSSSNDSDGRRRPRPPLLSRARPRPPLVSHARPDFSGVRVPRPPLPPQGIFHWNNVVFCWCHC